MSHKKSEGAADRVLARCEGECREIITQDHEAPPGMVGSPLDTFKAVLGTVRKILQKLFEMGLIEEKKPE